MIKLRIKLINTLIIIILKTCASGLKDFLGECSKKKNSNVDNDAAGCEVDGVK